MRGENMRLVVISDSHRHGRIVDLILRREREADYVFFLGDVTSDIEDLAYEYTDKKFHIVSGNCDFMPDYPYTEVVNVCGINVFACHGHTLGVKGGTGSLRLAAKQADCRIALYGHTHISNIEYADGLYIVNPGSCTQSRNGKNSYAVIDIRDNGILPSIVNI